MTTDLQIEIIGDNVHLTWTPIPFAIAYNVYGTDGTNIFYLGITSLPDFFDSGVVGSNEKRFYTVTALDSFVAPAKPETTKAEQNTK